MKLALPITCCLFLSLLCRSHAETAVFKAQNIRSTSDGISWADANGLFMLETKNPSGIQTGEKSGSEEDKSSVVFSGAQASPLRSRDPIKVPTSFLKLSLWFKAEATPAGAQTLIRQANWELRYVPDKKQMLFILWHDPKAYTTLAAPIGCGKWQRIVAIFEQGAMKLEVDGVVSSVVAKGSPGAQSPASALFVGACTGTLAPGAEFRPLRGALADIHVSMD